MSLSSESVRRPIFTTMVTLMVAVIGLVALSRLRIDLLPAIELPTLTVRTDYPGASPELVESRVTQIVEEVVATVPGVEELTSTSSEGESSVRVRFGWGMDLDDAVSEVRGRLEDELSELPDGVLLPQIRKFDIASFPVVILGISSTLDPVALTTLIDRQVRYRFARVPGVAQADLFGGYEREVRVGLDLERLVALQLPLSEVIDALAAANVDLPVGTIEQGNTELTLRAPAELTSLETLRQVPVAWRDGGPVRLGQVAVVEDTHERLTRIVRVNGEPGLRIGIRKQADANTVEVSAAVLAEIEKVNADYPEIKVVAVSNQGNFIERSIANVARSVLYGGGLAIAVLLFFLRSVRSTVVIGLAIPISIVATFALLYAGGFTLNLMTLGGLALGVGMMVDSAIVVLENIFQQRARPGETAETAAISGAGEVAGAIVASTLTTLVIFLPLAFVRGISGLLFQELAWVIVMALVCALAVALSLVPMLSARLLTDTPAPAPAAPGVGSAPDLLARLDAAYARLLVGAQARRGRVLAGVGLLLAGSLLLTPLIQTELLPPSDEGELRVTGEMALGTRLSLVDAQTRRLEALVIPAVPEAEAWVASVRSARGGDAAEGELQITLSPSSRRARSNTAIAADLRQRLAGQVPGMTVRTRAPQGQRALERALGSEEGLTVEVLGYDLDALDAVAAQVAVVAAAVPGVVDVDRSRKAGIPQAMLNIDRARAADLGISPEAIAQALEIAVAGRSAGDFRSEGTAHRILVQLQDAENLRLEDILGVMVRSRAGIPVPLRSMVSSVPGTGPLQIERQDQQRRVTVTLNTDGRPMGAVAAALDAQLRAMSRPAGVSLRVAGTYAEQQAASRELSMSLLLALALVYMVLACQYESLRAPLIVMLSVPLAAIGVILTLVLTGTTLNLQSGIGCIMLGGIVVNNAILLVDQAGQLQAELGATAAAREAGRRRLRPILMTTLTTLLGLLPLALGIGEGADAQAPLARTVIGGLASSTFITLVLIPTIYPLFYRGSAAVVAAPAGGEVAG